mgnify:CR=1 FL=1
MICKLKYLNYNKGGIENTCRYILFLADKMRIIAKKLGTKKIVVIYDRFDHFKNKFNMNAVNKAV